MDNPFGRVVAHWDAVIEDMDATAAAYAEEGWETITCHPGDVATITEQEDEPVEQPGFDVVLPGDEFDALSAAAADREFDSYEVFRGEGSGMAFCLLALESADEELAVFVPVYYELDSAEDLRAAAEHARGLYTHTRGLSLDEQVTFTHADPEPFFAGE